MQWSSKRLTNEKRPTAVKMTHKGRASGVTSNSMKTPMELQSRSRRTWNGKAKRKRCTPKPDSWAGSVKAPVTGCIAM
eukprot:scaffold49482_cov106-Phaeocystis_antarctica.AAC.1